MKKLVTFLTIAFSLLLAYNASAQKARIVKLPELLKVLESPGEEIRVVNFWATWCGPCVKEMPLFEKLTRDHKDVTVTLVSMDLDLDPNPEKVHKFVSRKKIESTVLILDESNANEYIDKIEKQWSGALPATIVINSKTGKRLFIEKEMHDGDLEKLIDQVR
jgi:thiol-disulfide isomerase/thioredoxin